MQNSKCVFVAIIGAPNAGKSTLLNALVGEKISIVSPKIQTTRRQIHGIMEVGGVQLIFIDTPGFCKPKTPLEKVISANFKNSYKDCDIVLLLIDSTLKDISPDVKILERLSNDATVAVVLNKVDIAKKENIARIASNLSKYEFVKHFFMISALKKDGIDEIRQFLCNSAPDGHWWYEANKATDLPITIRLAEITREKLFYHLDKELPYSVYVETENIHETDKKARIHQSIVVMKSSQKGIILGKAGSMIKKIKYEAINDMKVLFNKKIDLRLFVKVKEKWTEKKEHLQNAGIID